MLKNYLKTAFRTIRKEKLYSFLNDADQRSVSWDRKGEGWPYNSALIVRALLFPITVYELGLAAINPNRSSKNK